MQLRTDTRNVSRCSSDKLVFLRHLCCVTFPHVLSISSKKTYIYVVGSDMSCTPSGIFSSVHSRGFRRHRQEPNVSPPSALGALTLASCCCGLW
jgi:hypothetical protein